MSPLACGNNLGFRNLLEEIEFELEHGSEIVKEKVSQEKLSKKEVIGDLNGTLDNILEKLSQDDPEGRNETVEVEMDDRSLTNMNGIGHDIDVDASINVDWQKDPYHNMDEDQEIAHMLVELHQANDDVVFQNNDLEEPVVEPVVV
ncbi:hypothetical protein Tco_0067682 [Tanacetum coccineum]